MNVSSYKKKKRLLIQPFSFLRIEIENRILYNMKNKIEVHFMTVKTWPAQELEFTSDKVDIHP